jgi:LuxR family maltose regulon positive regulatory protein
MTFLLKHLPPQLHLVLATRADPPLPLASLRVRGHLLEVRAAELRFSLEEAGVFLQAVMGLTLPPKAIETLESRTEGWIAGLQLAALSLQGRTDVSTFLANFSGSHRFVLDYLSGEVLSHQPAAVQSFLFQTSILQRLSGSLCDSGSAGAGQSLCGRAGRRARLVSLPSPVC